MSFFLKNANGYPSRGFFILSLLLFLVCENVVVMASGPQPNIIFFMADDLGWSDVSTERTNLGHASDFYETPTISSLAEQGISFNNAYTNGPNCAPTRAALFSGQYAPRLTNNIFNVGNLNRGKGTLVGAPQGISPGGDELPEKTITIAETLKAAGYATAHLGKYHVGGSLKTNGPLQQGFDENFGGGPTGGPSKYHAKKVNGTWEFAKGVFPSLDRFAEPYTQEYIDKNIKPYSHNTDLRLLLGRPKHVTDALADAAIFFMEKNLQTPFFINYSEFAVHSPFNKPQARPDLLVKYQAKKRSHKSKVGHDLPSYAALVEGLDQSLGRLITYLKTTPDPRNPGHPLADNTLVVFYSDNGGLTTRVATRNGPLKGEKGELDEGGIRVPMVLWSPGLVKQPGRLCAEPVITVDFYKTFLELANASVPKNYPLDGESLVPLLKNPAATLTRKSIFWHFPGYLVNAGRNQRPQSVIRKGDFKLFYNYEERSYELYDLTHDIGETKNLLHGKATSKALAVGADLSRELRQWLIALKAPLPRFKNGKQVPLPALLLER